MGRPSRLSFQAKPQLDRSRLQIAVLLFSSASAVAGRSGRIVQLDDATSVIWEVRQGFALVRGQSYFPARTDAFCVIT